MNSASVLKTARILRLLVSAALVCNYVLLFLVPAAVMSEGHGLLGGVWEYLSGILFPGEDDIVTAGIFGSVLAWFWVWQDVRWVVSTLFLTVSGICTAAILRQARQILTNILRREAFSMENAAHMRRAALCSFAISVAALVRMVFGIFYHQSLRPITSYNALFVCIFAMAGLLCLVMSALFHQAVEIQAENDLII